MFGFSQSENSEMQSSLLTLCEAAISILKSGNNLEKGLGTIVEMVLSEGWHVEFHEEQSGNTASFSRKNGKRIDVYWADEKGKMKSIRHIIASIMHEYLLGELSDEASKSSDPIKYMHDHFRKFATLDVKVAESIDSDRSASETGFMLSHHRKTNLLFDMDNAKAKKLLAK